MEDGVESGASKGLTMVFLSLRCQPWSWGLRRSSGDGSFRSCLPEESYRLCQECLRRTAPPQALQQ